MPVDIRFHVPSFVAASRSINASIGRVRKAVAFALDESTDPILADMRSNCPQDTGALKASLGKRIKSYRGGSVWMAAIGPRRRVGRNRKTNLWAARYAHLVENGVPTRGIPAQPFIRPAWDAHSLTWAGSFVAKLMRRI